MNMNASDLQKITENTNEEQTRCAVQHLHAHLLATSASFPNPPLHYAHDEIYSASECN
jgi:hypothetical protein